MSALEKTIPVPDELTKPYWDAAKEHRFVLQQCTNCMLFASWPRVVCPRCHTTDFAWVEPSGRGKIHSYTIIRQTTRPGFLDEVPFILLNVQIDEEPSCFIISNLLIEEKDYDKVHIDLPVQVVFEDRGDVTVPQFKLV